MKISSQSLNIQIIDSISGHAVPYSNVYFSNNNGLISDEDGSFELIKSQLSEKDSMYISMLGYKKSSFLIKDFNDTLIKLVQSPIKLSDVILTNKKLSSEEIISKVVENIDKNYEKQFTENKIYLSRKSNTSTERFIINKLLVFTYLQKKYHWRKNKYKEHNNNRLWYKNNGNTNKK